VPFAEVLSLKEIRLQYSSILLFSVAMTLAQVLLPDLAQAQSVVVGMNVYDYTVRSHQEQDDEIDLLQKSGVKTIRTGLSDKSAYFITQAYKHGIGTIAILFPTNGSQAKPKRRWSDAPLSGADPDGFAKWLHSMLDPLEATGVRLTAMELGNEINNNGYNGDIPVPGSGRVLGLSDLNNPHDPEGSIIADGFRNYLRVMAALKEVRDHSKLNRKTPVLLAGMADWGLPSPKAWNGQLGVSLPDTIEFLRQNGLDRFAGGYAVHVYPTGNPQASVQARIAELEQKRILSKCTPDKPCWLTEWGISSNSQSCPLDDANRAKAVTAERDALQTYVQQKRLVGLIWFTWSGLPGLKEEPLAIFRCGGLTNAGKLALSPM
jgi:hypothetical protein